MTEFEYAQARSSTEQERLQFLHNAFINDRRPNTKAYFMSCHSNMLTYHQTLDRSVLYFEYALPEKPVKIAALSTTPEACRKFLAGTCLLGNKCKYYHAPAKPTAVTPPSGKSHPCGLTMGSAVGLMGQGAGARGRQLLCWCCRLKMWLAYR